MIFLSSFIHQNYNAMRNSLCTFLMLISLHILQANESTVSLPTISMSRAKMHINMLASDEMRGRNTPSPELEKAASYIADQFKQLGVLPINGSYYHTYTLERLHLDKPTTFIVKKGMQISEMALKDDFIPFEYSGSSNAEYAQLAFAGY